MLDHLVYAVPDLEAAIRELGGRYGVVPEFGGAHPGRGTANALLALGPMSYLEVIGPDPDQPGPDHPRHFGIDDLRRPHLAGWAARPVDFSHQVSIARDCGYEPGDIREMDRLLPDGTRLVWRMTVGAGNRYPGIFPFLIDWGDRVHPAALAPRGIRLRDFWCVHPDPQLAARVLRVLGESVRVQRGPKAHIVARLDTPAGPLVLR
jgi:hypothetical protein